MNHEYLIVKNFENSLTEEERVIFQNLLATDAEFKKEFEFRLQLKKAITLNEREKLREKLVQIEKNNTPRKMRFIWYAAASVVLFLGFYWAFLNQNHSTEQLYQEYYEEYPNIIHSTVRSGNTENDLKNQAFMAYDNREFEKSSVLFESLYKKNKEEYALFYQANSLLSENHTEEAVKIWESNAWTEKFADKVTWYLALAKLKQKDVESAKRLLQENLKSNRFKIQETKELLGKLD
ncbi:tetratricopeptide repeat protein [Moheibacter lacus]|uniref:Tetratricopeptide repeat-containing protein n=1 Tax=Moheibacter lacus TaxID=2745851 RepID=A0A838ZTT0_9FLAO|nr:hypothetical protein [Moheibacter lacus]MBA5630400.1 hypothetical protein [Moheibacter lacus]